MFAFNLGEHCGACFSGAFETCARLLGMGLFMGVYFSKYFPTDDLLLFNSFFLSSLGLWKIVDCLDTKTDSLVKRLEEKIGKRDLKD